MAVSLPGQTGNGSNTPKTHTRDTGDVSRSKRIYSHAFPYCTMLRITPINLLAVLLCIACLGCNQTEISSLQTQISDLQDELSECQQAQKDSEARILELTEWRMAAHKTIRYPKTDWTINGWRFKVGQCPSGYCFERHIGVPLHWEVFMAVDVKEYDGYMEITGANDGVYRLTYD